MKRAPSKPVTYLADKVFAWSSGVAVSIAFLIGLPVHADLSGLVGYWPFDEGSGLTTADATNNNSGTLVGGPAWVASPWGAYGLEFDGVDDYVDVGSPASGVLDFDETQSFSFGAWIKPLVIPTSNGKRFISKIGDENAGYALAVWAGSQGAFADVSDGTVELSTGDFFPVPVAVGQWSFILAVVNRGEATLRVYVNGVEAESVLDIYGMGSLSSAAALNFGRASGNSARSFTGVMDEVRIYNRALSAEDVQELLLSMQKRLEFVLQPTHQTVEAGGPATFAASFDGTPPYFCQWYSNDVAIADATDVSYTIPTTTLEMSGTVYSVTVSNLFPSSITSSGATLTVAKDLTRPTLLKVVSRYPNEVVALFSEAVSVGTAEATKNYVLTNAGGQPVPVTAALLSADGRTVTLTPASELLEAADYVLVVSAVEDLAAPPNTIVSGTSGLFRLQTLVGHWTFDEGSGTTAADLSGFGNHGALLNGPTWVEGQLGKALLFDGGRAYVSVGDPLIGVLDFGVAHSFSFGAWIKPTLLDTTGRRFISKRTSADAGYDLLVINRNGRGLVSELGDGAMAPSAYDAGILAPLEADRWYHAMAVVDRSLNEMRLYLNGVLQGPVDLSGLTSLEVSAPLEFGRLSEDSSRSFAGAIDDVRLYSRALMEEEIVALATPPPPQFLPPTLSGGQIHLNWTGTGQLEWAPTAQGPWAPVSPAPPPPYDENVLVGANRFFRLNAGR